MLSLSELGKLIHVVPGAAGQVAPKIAASVQKIGSPAMIKALVAQSPELRDDIMTALSTDARNLDIVLSLRTQASSNAWQPFMVQSLVGAGNYNSALGLWASINRVSSNAAFRPLIFDPEFHHKLAQPFGWTLADQSVTSGVAEPLERGGLHVISYGRDPFTVASQTLLLSPGNYMLSQVASSTSGEISTLSWQVSCLGSERKLGRLALSRGRASGQFTVPNNCPAQRIDLLAMLGDLPETLDATLDPVALRHRR